MDVLARQIRMFERNYNIIFILKINIKFGPVSILSRQVHV